MIVGRIRECPFNLIFASSHQSFSLSSTQAVIRPVDMILIRIPLDLTASCFTDHAQAQVLTLLTRLTLCKLVYCFFISFVLFECKSLACRTDITVLFSLIGKLVMVEVRMASAGGNTVADARGYAVFAKVFINFSFAVPFVSDNGLDVYTGMNLMGFDNPRYKFVIIDVRRGCYGRCYNAAAVIDRPVIFIPQGCLAVLSPQFCIRIR
mgnify:CR=1 FL=1